MDLLVDLHRDGPRQGPGGDAETRLALALAGLVDRPGLNIADIGCGTGAATLELVRDLDATVTAVDCVPAFLDDLKQAAARAGLANRIVTLAAPMEDLPFADGALDAIWSEGAIYNMGFDAGIVCWRRFLKPGGVLAVTDLTWLTGERPGELDRYWRDVYPGVATASEKIAALEGAGYSPLGYFPLPARCWLENFYVPLRGRFPAFLARHGESAAARAVVAAEEAESDLYERFQEFYGYGFFVARRTGD